MTRLRTLAAELCHFGLFTAVVIAGLTFAAIAGGY